VHVRHPFGTVQSLPTETGGVAVSIAAQLDHVTHPGPESPHASMRAALDEGQLVLHYLPVVNLDTGEPQGVEALLRWQHPVGGLVGPDDFLSGVAHTSLMREITGWVLRTAAAALAQWPGWTVSVNVTANDVSSRQLVEQVDDALSDAHVPAERLVVELTEQAMVENLTRTRRVLGALRDRGVGVSLDDFGTGYSSLLYLRDLPITELKIDRAFVSPTPPSAADLAIVASVAALGRTIGVAVVAEGVETCVQLQVTRDAGCTAAQGFLWGAPAASEAISPDDLRRDASAALGPQPVLAPAAPPAVPLSQAGARIKQLLSQGASLHTIAAALNLEGSRTPHGTRWTASSVASVIAGTPMGRAHRKP
jgi:EAL domain-containing protein (putative c-di-GMP-specific phosphodiesterase class I)